MALHEAHGAELLAAPPAAEADEQAGERLADDPGLVGGGARQGPARGGDGVVDALALPGRAAGCEGDGLELRRLEHRELAEHAVGHQRLEAVGRVADVPGQRVRRGQPVRARQPAALGAGSGDDEEVEVGPGVDAVGLASDRPAGDERQRVVVPRELGRQRVVPGEQASGRGRVGAGVRIVFSNALFPSPWHPDRARTWHLVRLNLSSEAAAVCWAFTAPPKIVRLGQRLRVIPRRKAASVDRANPRTQPTPATRGAGSPERSRLGSLRPLAGRVGTMARPLARHEERCHESRDQSSLAGAQAAQHQP